MRNKLLRISFFSFQDIITATTGIIILITIILTFFLKSEDFRPSTGPTINEVINNNIQLNQEIEELTSSIQTLENIVTEWSKRDLQSILQKIEDLRVQSEKYDNQINNLKDGEENLVQLVENLNNIKLKYTNLVSQSIALNGDLSGLKSEQTHVENPNIIFIIPEIPDEKRIFYVVISNDTFVIYLYNSNNTKRKVFNSNESFLEYMKNNSNKEITHIVFFIRPSGIDKFIGINGGMLRPGLPAPISDLGYKYIGWQPLPEQINLEFR